MPTEQEVAAIKRAELEERTQLEIASTLAKILDELQQIRKGMETLRSDVVGAGGSIASSVTNAMAYARQRR